MSFKLFDKKTQQQNKRKSQEKKYRNDKNVELNKSEGKTNEKSE